MRKVRHLNLYFLDVFICTQRAYLLVEIRTKKRVFEFEFNWFNK